MIDFTKLIKKGGVNLTSFLLLTLPKQIILFPYLVKHHPESFIMISSLIAGFELSIYAILGSIQDLYSKSKEGILSFYWVIISISIALLLSLTIKLPILEATLFCIANFLTFFNQVLIRRYQHIGVFKYQLYLNLLRGFFLISFIIFYENISLALSVLVFIELLFFIIFRSHYLIQDRVVCHTPILKREFYYFISLLILGFIFRGELLVASSFDNTVLLSNFIFASLFTMPVNMLFGVPFLCAIRESKITKVDIVKTFTLVFIYIVLAVLLAPYIYELIYSKVYTFSLCETFLLISIPAICVPLKTVSIMYLNGRTLLKLCLSILALIMLFLAVSVIVELNSFYVVILFGLTVKTAFIFNAIYYLRNNNE